MSEIYIQKIQIICMFFNLKQWKDNPKYETYWVHSAKELKHFQNTQSLFFCSPILFLAGQVTTTQNFASILCFFSLFFLIYFAFLNKILFTSACFQFFITDFPLHTFSCALLILFKITFWWSLGFSFSALNNPINELL